MGGQCRLRRPARAGVLLTDAGDPLPLLPAAARPRYSNETRSYSGIFAGCLKTGGHAASRGRSARMFRAGLTAACDLDSRSSDPLGAACDGMNGAESRNDAAKK